MKLPRKVKHRNKVLAKIYRPCGGQRFYRVAWYATGKRQMKAFASYSGPGGAKEYAEKLVKELAKQSSAAMLTSPQASDALAAIERLNTFDETTGKRISLLTAVSEYCAAAGKLKGRTMTEAVEGFARTVGAVQQKDLMAAVEEFNRANESRTIASNGQRAQLSPKYNYGRAIMLRRFASAFPGYAVGDLGKHDLDAFMTAKAVAAFSAKSRNHHRAVIKQLLEWAARKDYLAQGHRLLEADALRPEHANTAEIQFYTPEEFGMLLETATGPLRAMIALGGLAGLRTQELLRLDWADVWRVPGHVEVTAIKSKTRSRRLVTIVPALTAWLKPYGQCKSGPVWTEGESIFQKAFLDLCAGSRKKNGLRHSFCSFHFALHANENLTAQQAGHAPSMVHQFYKGLCSRKEAAAWFAVRPTQPAKMGKTIPTSTTGPGNGQTDKP